MSRMDSSRHLQSDFDTLRRVDKLINKQIKLLHSVSRTGIGRKNKTINAQLVNDLKTVDAGKTYVERLNIFRNYINSKVTLYQGIVSQTRSLLGRLRLIAIIEMEKHELIDLDKRSMRFFLNWMVRGGARKIRPDTDIHLKDFLTRIKTYIAENRNVKFRYSENEYIRCFHILSGGHDSVHVKSFFRALFCGGDQPMSEEEYTRYLPSQVPTHGQYVWVFRKVVKTCAQMTQKNSLEDRPAWRL